MFKHIKQYSKLDWFQKYRCKTKLWKATCGASYGLGGSNPTLPATCLGFLWNRWAACYVFFLHWWEADHMQTFYRSGENDPSWNVSCGDQLDDVPLPAQLLGDSELVVIKCSLCGLGERAQDGSVQYAPEHSWSWLLSGERCIYSTLRTRISAEWTLSSYLCDEPKGVGSRASCWGVWQALTPVSCVNCAISPTRASVLKDMVKSQWEIAWKVLSLGLSKY